MSGISSSDKKSLELSSTALSKKAALKISYKKTMNTIQQEMNRPARLFSKFIHNGIIDKLIILLRNTLLRPMSILVSSIAALIALLAFFAVSYYYGFALSGFEGIAAFIIGWLAGVILELIKVLVSGKTTT